MPSHLLERTVPPGHSHSHSHSHSWDTFSFGFTPCLWFLSACPPTPSLGTSFSGEGSPWWRQLLVGGLIWWPPSTVGESLAEPTGWLAWLYSAGRRTHSSGPGRLPQLTLHSQFLFSRQLHSPGEGCRWPECGAPRVWAVSTPCPVLRGLSQWSLLPLSSRGEKSWRQKRHSLSKPNASWAPQVPYFVCFLFFSLETNTFPKAESSTHMIPGGRKIVGWHGRRGLWGLRSPARIPSWTLLGSPDSPPFPDPAMALRASEAGWLEPSHVSRVSLYWPNWELVKMKGGTSNRHEGQKGINLNCPWLPNSQVPLPGLRVSVKRTSEDPLPSQGRSRDKMGAWVFDLKFKTGFHTKTMTSLDSSSWAMMSIFSFRTWSAFIEGCSVGHRPLLWSNSFAVSF